MKLSVKKRTHERKSDCAKLRREGMIPAVIYHKEKEGETVAIPNLEFISHLRGIQSGHLATTVFSLTEESGKVRKAIIKDIQYRPTNYEIIHLDFEELHDKIPVKVKVPVIVEGEADSVGVKLGGVVRTVIRQVKVECLPKDIPPFFKVNVKDMNLGQVRKLSDLQIPNSVRPLIKTSEVVITMVKR